MAKPTKRLNIAAGRPYTTASGENKKQWINIGRATEWDDGSISLELHSIPVGNWFDGRASLFPQDENRDQQRSPAQPQRQQQAPASDDILF